jgi:tRNA wybutosine-synthesizing protein 3
LLVLLRAGGWLHIHENVRDVEEKDFAARLPDTLKELAAGVGHEEWVAEVRHVERVKWYAPHIRHLVLDVWCGPAAGWAGGGRTS